MCAVVNITARMCQLSQYCPSVSFVYKPQTDIIFFYMPPSFISQNTDITALSAFRTPAKAAYFWEIQTEDDVPKLSQVLAFANEKNLRVVFL